MEQDELRAAKRQMLALMQAGHYWQVAADMAGVRLGRSAAYQLLRNVRLWGEAALQDSMNTHQLSP